MEAGHGAQRGATRRTTAIVAPDDGRGSPTLDLDAYLERIGFHGGRTPGRELLDTLHSAHVTSIPFENVDVRLGRPIGLDLESLQAKLVRRRRGGYCFEHNTLFSTALRMLGFDVTTLEARVRPREATAVLPRTHMTLRVALEGGEVLADVGFGGMGPLVPVPFDGNVSEQPGGAYRIVREGDALHVLQGRWRGEWGDLYAFTLTPALPVDYVMANHFTSTHPSSGFVQRFTAQRNELGRRHMLRGRSYMVRENEEETVREVSDEELPGLLRERFGLDVSDEELRGALGDDE